MDGCSGAVQREYLLPGGLEGCYWREVWRTRELHYYTQTENIKPLRVACSGCTCPVFCGRRGNILDQWCPNWLPRPAGVPRLYLRGAANFYKPAAANERDTNNTNGQW